MGMMVRAEAMRGSGDENEGGDGDEHWKQKK